VVGFGLISLTGLLCVPAGVAAAPVKAAVIRSQGTQFLGMTIWPELNAGWADFGDVPVEIDYTSLAGNNLTFAQIAATGADVLILSCPGFLTYREAEIDAMIDYVEAGHGLIITYGSFLSEDRRLAPFVGLSESIVLGTATVTDPIQFDLVIPDHPVFGGLTDPYVSGVSTRARPWAGGPWELDGGTVIADLFTEVIPAGPGIIVREASTHRGLYFSHYIENKSDGSNEQDMQVFYNGLLWSAGVPEPATGMLLLAAIAGVLSKRRRR